MPLNSYNAANIVLYAGGHPQREASVILPADGSLFAAVGVNKLIIERDSIEQLPEVRWQDGFGHPVLTAQQQAGRTLYALYTHINPDWNELPWSDNFPAILYTLVYPNSAAATFDKALIDPAQAMPLMQSSKENNAKPALSAVTQLSAVCWLIAFILLFAERSLSFYYSKSKTNG